MKKLLLAFIFAVGLMNFLQLNASVVKSDQYKFEFDGVLTSTVPIDPVITATAGTSNSIFGIANGSAAIANNTLAFTGGGSGSRGATLANLNGGAPLLTTKKEIVEFDWTVNTTAADAMAYNILGISDQNKNPILVLVVERWSSANSGIHFMNLTPSKLSAAYTLEGTGVYTNGGDYKTDCVNAFAESWIGADFTNGKSYKVKAKLDFATHTIDSIWITRVDDPTIVYVKDNVPFLSTSATNVDLVSAAATRGRNQSNGGNGGNSNLNMVIDNYHVYSWKIANAASLTVNYYNVDDNTLVKSVIRENQLVGGVYSATVEDKATFSEAGFNYVFSNVINDNVEVLSDNTSHIDINVKKYPVISGDFTWTGIIDGSWNELNANFTTDGINALGYQVSNGVIFPSNASSKEVVLNNSFNLGAGNINVNSDLYTFNGTGTLSGTGKLIVNPGEGGLTVFNLSNNLTGGVNVLSGTLEVGKTASGSSFELADGTQLTLNPDVDFNKPILGAGSVTIKTLANKFYSSPITGASTVNLILGVSGSLSSGVNWSSKVTSLMPANAQVNVTTTEATAGYGVQSQSLSNSKLSLGENVRLLHNYNPSEGGSSIYVGELNGTSTSTVEGGWVDSETRNLNYEIGSLNTDATFNGKFKHYGTIVNAPLNVFKKGTGVWTLTGTSDAWSKGSFNVDAGKVVMDGEITSTTVPATVASGATLTGTGTIGGMTTVNGTLEGRMNFGSDLNLYGTTNIQVNGFNAGEFDVINIAGGINNGGALNIQIANDPSTDGSIQLIKASVYVGAFNAVNIISPSNPAQSSSQAPRRAPAANVSYSYDQASGVLTFSKTPTSVDKLNSEFELYPTFTKGEVYVKGNNVNKIEVLNLAGQIIKQIQTTNQTSVVNLSGISNGAYLIKISQVDGSSITERIILQK